MKKRSLLVGCSLLVAIAAVVIVLFRDKTDDNGRSELPRSPTSNEQREQPLIADLGAQGTVHATTPQQTEAAEEAEEEPTPEEKTEAEEEKLVDAFDALTDKWMEPATNGVAMAEVDKFVKQFAQVPKNRKEECLQRALNLIPDENVMLLVGVLMDKTQDKELVELVFNDILNRDEGVKKPILQQIFRDKTHPCWADAAWILDVTGEKE